MSTAFRRWSRSIVAALAMLILVSVVPVVGNDIAAARPAALLQTHV